MSEKEFADRYKQLKKGTGIIIGSLVVIIICGIGKFFYDHATLPTEEKRYIQLQATVDVMKTDIAEMKAELAGLCHKGGGQISYKSNP